ncbi:hypothetical protein AGRA3207_007179 [Actinomadura graeca]|uniref:Uncharacterized protein n=1 Tax=Actinomadura graeca TaxID=2750812 RepID=A0ABX8R9K5_9ACTN|nr:hypothetical protein [Actinomadura graeca]QXJ25658.1 hypothetical protein AGRA3207_007179 [Actinomadura graeca]
MGEERAALNVIALGAPGAGKTTYLAALHNEVKSDPFPGVAVSLAQSAQAAELDRIHRQAADPCQEWPASTLTGEGIREFTFRLVVEASRITWRNQLVGSRYPVLTLTYLDYAGEFLPDADLFQEEAAEFDERLAAADALLGIIDGHQLLKYMLRSGPRDEKAFLDNLARVVGRLKGAAQPVHFLVTKWDLFEGRFTFTEVRDALLATPPETGFAVFVANRTSRRQRFRKSLLGRVRLIPVSGYGGVAFLGEDMTVQRDPGGRLSRQNVIVPLAAAVADITDHFVQIATVPRDPAEIEADRRAAVEFGRAAQSASELKVGPTGVHINVFAVLTAALVGVPKVGRLLVVPGMALGRSARRQYRRVRARRLAGVRTVEGAAFYLASLIDEEMQAFDARFQESKLTYEPPRRR